MDNNTDTFFVQQVYPYQLDLEELADVGFVPYGTTIRSTVNGSFVCAKGDIQCNANKIHVNECNIFSLSSEWTIKR